MKKKFMLSLSFAATCIALAAPALADDQADPPVTTHAAVPPSDVRLDVGAGVFADGYGQAGGTLGVMALRRSGLFELGLDASAGNSFDSYSFGNADAAAGVGWQTASGFRLDVLGEIGATYYHGVGQEVLSDNPGINGVTPSARAKAGVSYVFAPQAQNHFTMGLWVYGEDDLTRQQENVDYEQHGVFGGTTNENATDTLGTTRLGGVLSLGGVL